MRRLGIVRRCWLWSLVMVVALLVVACGGPGSGGTTSTPSAQRVKVVTTMSILADMVRQIGGSRVQAENIIPIGAGPEDFQPSPQDVQKIAEADIVFYNGHGLEGWLGDLFKNAARSDQPQIAVSDGLSALGVGEGEFVEGNPHFWLSAAYGARYAQRIREGLIQVDPAGQAVYEQQGDAYIQQLLALHVELQQQALLLPAEARTLVTNHDAFPYFAQDYGFTVVGTILGSAEAEPSAGDLAQLVRKVQDEHVKAVFSESQFSSRLTEAIAQEAGVKVVTNLYTDTLAEAGDGPTSYIEMLRYDMIAIVDALK